MINDPCVVVAALYRFAPFADPGALAAPLAALCRAGRVKGTLLLAHEGINGTIAGPAAGIDAVLAHVRALPDCAQTDVKLSEATTMPFGRLKVRVKREIVTLGVPGLDPRHGAGTHVAPAAWNALISDPGTLVIDTRNAYEVAVGSFAGAVDPGTRSFREFPAWWEAHRDHLTAPDGQPPRRIAMFCTGGIRCEKSTALLRQHGLDEVYHLQGGVLNYLAQVPPEASLFHGECYVFDQRVALDHALAPGTHHQCPACGTPLPGEQTTCVCETNRLAHCATQP